MLFLFFAAKLACPKCELRLAAVSSQEQEVVAAAPGLSRNDKRRCGPQTAKKCQARLKKCHSWRWLPANSKVTKGTVGL